jgi:hypothetical protein
MDFSERATKDPDNVEADVWIAFCVYALDFCQRVMEW